MSKAPFVSIIVPTKNCENTIEDLLNSIFEQTYRRFEVLVIDSSEDATAEIVKKYRKVRLYKLPALEKIRRANAARNVGIKKAKGEILAFTDGDCIVDKNWLKELINGFKTKDIACVGGSVFEATNNFFAKYCEIALLHPTPNLKREMIINSSQFYKPYLPLSSNLAIRKEIFKKIGFFNEGIQAYEEIEFLWRVLTKGYKIFYTPKAKVWHNHPRSLIKLAKRYFRDGKGCMEFSLQYPNSPLSLVRLTLFLGWLFYLSFLFLSLLFRNLEILFLIFFLPLSLLFLYYFYVCFKRKYALAILYPFLDIMLCGIVYPLGMLIKLFSLTKRLHYEAK